MKPQAYPRVVRTANVANQRVRYDGFAMSLHWLTVILVLAQLATSQIWGFLPRPERHPWIVAHMSFGILLAGVVSLRLVWRLIPTHRLPSAVTGWMKIMSTTVAGLLYAALTLQAVLGIVLRWSGDEAMSFFGLLIGPPFAPSSKSTHEVIGDCHNLLGWSIIFLALGHATAALFHHYALHDDVLWRMLPGRFDRRGKGQVS